MWRKSETCNNEKINFNFTMSSCNKDYMEQCVYETIALVKLIIAMNNILFLTDLPSENSRVQQFIYIHRLLLKYKSTSVSL